MEPLDLATLAERLPMELKKLKDTPQHSHEQQVVIRFFTRMAHMFGHKWASVYGETMKDGQLGVSARLWQEDLNRLSKEDIARGIEATYALNPEWPPNPMEFAAICKAAKPKEWADTWQGIEAMGASLGIELKDYPHFPAFKDAVMRAAKVQPLKVSA